MSGNQLEELKMSELKSGDEVRLKNMPPWSGLEGIVCSVTTRQYKRNVKAGKLHVLLPEWHFRCSSSLGRVLVVDKISDSLTFTPLVAKQSSNKKLLKLN